MWFNLMAVPVLFSEFFRSVGVAIFALVRTGVILPDVLAHHAAAGLPLPLVGLVFSVSSCSAERRQGRGVRDDG